VSDTFSLRPEEVLGGLTGRRVSSALYAVESRAGLLALADRHAAAPAICEGMVATAERDYLSALRSGEALPAAPRIQHLERSAAAWAHLVPASPTLRAGLAHALTGKYAARPRDVPRLRRAIGFADPAVVAEHLGRYGTEPDAGWAASLPVAERLRWRSARLAERLEGLPPFWSAFALTLTQTVGAGILALPIALAGIGPLPGLVLIVVLGLANVLTVTAIAESVTRTGTVRWSGAYIGGVVREHLGRGAASVTALALLAFAVASLTAYYIGLAGTLEAAVGVPAAAWVGALFATTMAFVWRGRMGATIASALLVGALNLLIIALLVVAAATALEPGRLTRVELSAPGTGGFDPSILGLVFGVVLMAYFGHTAVAAGARDILRRDPGGRSLVRGTATAMLAVIALYAVWTLAVAGAVDGTRLEGETGTALAPLAEAVGPAVLALGTVFAVSAMGMAAVHSSVGLHAQTTELLRGRGRAGRLSALAPLVAVFLLVEALVLTGRASFTAALGLVGTLAIPVVAGVVPVLLLASARRRGDYVPGGRLRAASAPVLALVWLLFVGAVAAHGLVIWTGTVDRVLAGLAAVVIVAVTVLVLRSDAMRPLTTLEVRRDRDLGLETLQLTAAGQPGRTTVTSHGAHGTSTGTIDGSTRLPELTTEATVEVPTGPAPELRVWAHEVDPFGLSQPIRPQVRVGEEPADLHTGSTTVLLPRGGEGIPVTIGLRPAHPSAGDRP
jgi:amino acid permease